MTQISLFAPPIHVVNSQRTRFGIAMVEVRVSILANYGSASPKEVARRTGPPPFCRHYSLDRTEGLRDN